jgi:sigma-54 dependent transcriptional regulator, acetoin dehydrogenase operon transcriptional activator AcoR
MGTCLALAAPVAVQREDHFFSQFAQLTCSAVPVYDPQGRVAAVLDVTSQSGLMQQHLLVLLGMTARMIENRLIDMRFNTAHPLHFHSRPEFVYTLHEGKLALDDDGRILAANRSALFQLNLSSMEELHSRRIEDLFQTSLEDMLRRSSSSAYHPVVTYRANAAPLLCRGAAPGCRGRRPRRCQLQAWQQRCGGLQRGPGGSRQQ